MKKIILFLFLIFLIHYSNAQGVSAIAVLKFEEAEVAFNNYNYKIAIEKIDEFENLVGEITSKSLFLRIVCQEKLLASKDIFADEAQYQLLSDLRENSDTYLTSLENEEVDDKYREVYKIKEKLKSYPSSKAEFLIRMEKNQADLEKAKIEEEKRKAEAAKKKEIEAEEARIKALNKAIEDKKIEDEKKEIAIRNRRLSFVNIGFQTGNIGKYGVVIESMNSDNKVGIRMAVRGSFIQGETVSEFDLSYVPTTEEKQGRFSLDMGPIFRIAHPFYVYTGLGFGSYTDWILYDVYNSSGSFIEQKHGAFDESDIIFLESSIGVIIKLGRVVSINTGVSLLNFGSPEFTYGISFNFIKNGKPVEKKENLFRGAPVQSR